jgi:hypothetical protein
VVVEKCNLAPVLEEAGVVLPGKVGRPSAGQVREFIAFAAEDPDYGAVFSVYEGYDV